VGVATTTSHYHHQHRPAGREAASSAGEGHLWAHLSRVVEWWQIN
jgi:hypothetical protein